MIGAGNQPPNPDLEDLEDELISDASHEMSQTFTDAMIGNITISTSGVQVLGMDEYDTIRMPSIDGLLKLADENLLQAVETVDKDQAAMIGEDNFKKRSKDVLTKKMQEEIIKKTKFTMLKDPREQTIVTRAKVYVFSEQDLRFFIENIAKNS